MGGLLKFLTGPLGELVKGVGGIIDSVSTTTEEKMAAQAKLAEIANAFTLQMATLDTQFAVEQAKVVVAEAQSESWITRNWRPILMLVFTYIILHNYVLSPMFSLPRVEIPEHMWELLKIGMGGYIFGRSGEYVAEQIGKGIAAKSK